MLAGDHKKAADSGRSDERPGHTYWSWLILIVGLLTSVAAYFLVRDWEEAIIRAEFELFASTHAAAVHRELIRHMDSTAALAGLYDASLEVDRDEFRKFTASLLGQHGDIQAVMWAPRVPVEERAALERRAAREGLKNFRIREFSSGALPPAEAREAHYPVFFLQPMEQNADLLGFDSMSNPAYRGALEVARDTGEVAASGPIHVNTEQGLEYGLLVAQAVYQKGVALDSLVERRTALQGYVMQLFRVGDFIEEALAETTTLGLDLSVLYEKSPDNSQRIYIHASRSRKIEGLISTLTSSDENSVGLIWRTSLGLLDQPWELRFTPAPHFWAGHPVWRSWVVSLTGALMSILLGTYIMTLSRQSRRAESLARRLTRANENLEDEIVGRTLVEEQAVKLSHAIQQAADAVMITDRNGIIEYVNPAFESMTGYAREEAVGKKSNLVRSGRHDAAFYSQLWGTIARGGVYQDVLINRRKNGVLYYEEKTITPLKDRAGNVTHYIATGKDITERMQTQERLHYLAYNDLLTELPNRLLFLERLGHALQVRRGPAHRLAIMFLDLDRFKVINDTLGHQIGDALLQKIAGLLPATVSEGDTVARLGGDEFGVLLEELPSLDTVAVLARKLLATFSQPFHIGGHELYITPSIGVSVYPEDGNDADTLLKNADVAMYRAKDQGGNTYQYYSSDMSSKAFERLSLETSLRRALEREEFRVYYQPQIDLLSGKLAGAEALIRWQHPDLGVVSPLEFIPLLEETGLIVPVGDWILRQACQWAAAGQRHGPLQVSVNLSGRQFRDPGLAERVTQALEMSGLKPTLLELEITESVLMQSDKNSVENLLALDRVGARLAIDDFGTGYSSLAYLKRFPIKTLKIDRTFIRDINVDQDDAAIVTAIIAMAHGLKVEVVAEGVETTQQLDFLRELGCDTIQGFLISRPLPVAEVNRFIARGRQVLGAAPPQARGLPASENS